MRAVRWLLWVLLLAQGTAALRVIARLVRTGGGDRIREVANARELNTSVTVIVPVLNEEYRLAPCLAGLHAQGREVREILVVDGGSVDGTRGVVELWAMRDARVRYIDTSPVPEGWNGKPWGLQVGA